MYLKEFSAVINSSHDTPAISTHYIHDWCHTKCWSRGTGADLELCDLISGSWLPTSKTGAHCQNYVTHLFIKFAHFTPKRKATFKFVWISILSVKHH